MNLIIGIDPDKTSSGVAIFEGTRLSSLRNMTFFDLSMWLILRRLEIKLVVIEGGHLNKKSNFHPAMSPYVRDNIAKKVGQNHMIGELLVELCENYDIPFKCVKPTKGKIKSKEFYELTGVKRSNQEQRDAAMLILRI